VAKPKETIVETAKRRFDEAQDFNNINRGLALEDTRFAMGDSDNGWQWPAEVYLNRSNVQKKPCLTINTTAQHCNQIINNIRQNRPAARVLPVDSGADVKTAEILGGMIRSIQSQSAADTAHDLAAEHSIYGGEGYWRIITEYESPESFNQVIKIKAIPNPRLVFIDPHAKEPDRSDARWGFVFEDISKQQCEEDYPDLDCSSWGDTDKRGWIQKDTIRRAEYFWCEYVSDTLYLLETGQAVLKSELPEGVEVKDKFLTMQGQSVSIVQERETQRKQWKWCKLIGGSEKPIEEREWPGSYLPIITVVGKELNVDGQIIRKGIVRDLKDPARMVNYSYSAAVETLALQNKVPYIAAAEAMEGFEDIWGVANLENRAYLPINAFTEDGKPIPPPARQPPAVMPTAQVQMLQLSTEEMRAASGQQNANFGIKSEAQSGIGIQRLKVQGETATFHFPDNLVRGLHYEAKVLIDLIPKIYDAPRIVRILGLGGEESAAQLDPSLEQAYAKQDGEIKDVFNPMVGKYDVTIDTGPSFQTQRQEAAAALTELATKNPQLMQVAGDLIVRSYDFPGADEIAKRLAKTLPPGLKEEDEDNPEQQQLMQAMQQMEQMQQAGMQLEQQVDELKGAKEEAIQAKLAADAEKAKNIKLETEIFQLKAVEKIKAAQDEFEQVVMQAQAGQVEQGERTERPEPAPQQMQPMIMPDVNGQLVGALGPVLAALADSTANTSEALSTLAMGQQQMAETIAAGQEQTAILLAEAMKPKQSFIKVSKQPDGSFVGQKTEA
jgi:hypothetical protein